MQRKKNELNDSSAGIRLAAQRWAPALLTIFCICIFSLIPSRAQETEPSADGPAELRTLRPPEREHTPPRPWGAMARKQLPPARPGKDFTPSVTPGGVTADYKIVNGVKVFHLTASEFDWQVVPGLTARVWGYNGRVPGPTVEVGVGDRVRLYVTNNLPAKTSVHWHGMLIPCGMDGVSGLTQPAIKPGETFVYEFIVPESGTFMYHPHFDSMTQEGAGMTGMFIVHDRLPEAQRPDRDFVIMLHEWRIEADQKRPNTLEQGDFNILTMNGHAMPGTAPLVARTGQRVWIRLGNLSPMDHHPIHLHGYSFNIIGTDGGWISKSARIPATTVLVQVGSAKVIEFVADNPGDWLMHCHMTHHTMNQMGHGFPNPLGMKTEGFDEEVRKLLPGYKTVGTTGMRDMTKMMLPLPENSVPMLGGTFQFGNTVLGGMATVLKVRDELESYDDPGWYEFPKGTVSRKATDQELQRDGIAVDLETRTTDGEAPSPGATE